MPIRHLPFLLAGAAMAFAWPVAADCELAGPIEEALPAAPIAFVGTVTRAAGPIATFAVTEVWAGDVGATVEIRGLSDDGGVGEDDRLWTPGERYLVLPIIDRGALRDHGCTATTEWRPELDRLRPDDARITSTAATGGVDVPTAVLVVVAVVLVTGGASVLVFRRR